MIYIDRIAGIGGIAGGVSLLYFGSELGIGNLRMPGPGAWPYLIGLTIASLGGWFLIRPDPTAQPAITGKSRWGRLILALLTLFGYVLALAPLGYLMSTTLLLLIQLRLVEGCRWRISLLLSLSGAGISFIVFNIWLKVSLPAGIIPLRWS